MAGNDNTPSKGSSGQQGGLAGDTSNTSPSKVPPEKSVEPSKPSKGETKPPINN
jgi:hypothetical protein